MHGKAQCNFAPDMCLDAVDWYFAEQSILAFSAVGMVILPRAQSNVEE